ncbi:MAG: hypothetical protein P1P88_16065 [Bacteroidales bacterium]|nr:hypothetical protein [Bacteroidales bacterium]
MKLKLVLIILVCLTIASCTSRTNQISGEQLISNYFNGFNNANFNQISACVSDSILITEGDFIIAKSKKELYTNFQWDSVFLPKYQLIEIKTVKDGFETTVSKIDRRIKFLQDTSIIYKIIIHIIDNQIAKMQITDYLQFDFEKWQSRRDSLKVWTDSNHPELSGFLDVQTKEKGLKYLKAINLYEQIH